MNDNLVSFAPVEQLVFLKGLNGMSEGYSNGHNGTINYSAPVTYDSCGRQQGTSFDNSYDASIWLTRISFPLFLVVGTLGNATGIILLFREDNFCRGRKVDSSRGRKIFLQALFTSDLCYLWNRLIVLVGAETWTDASAGNMSAMYEPGFFLYTNGFWLFMDALLSFSSQGILVLFCVDRYFALTAPLQHKTNINFQRRTTLILVCVVYFCTAASSLLLPVLYYHRLSLMSMRRDEKVPELSKSLTRWRVFDAWFEFFIRIVSAIIIITLNRLIFVKLKRSPMRLAVHFDLPKNQRDPELHCIISKSSSQTSRSAIIILMCSSIFYLLTNALDIFLALMTVLSIYPVCWFQMTSNTWHAYEPARDLFKHGYFAFSFLFYVCLKLRIRESFYRHTPHSGSFYRHSTEIRADKSSAML